VYQAIQVIIGNDGQVDEDLIRIAAKLRSLKKSDMLKLKESLLGGFNNSKRMLEAPGMVN
jgi:hypothetical protein